MIAPLQIGRIPYPLLARLNRRNEHAPEDEHIIRMVDHAAREHEFKRMVSYRYMSGQAAASPLHVIFLTLFNHRAHHRGQIHCTLSQAGLTPGDSDVIDYLEAIKQDQGEA